MRTTPRISVSKLGEYLTATPRRRRSIVADQKRPKDFVVIWYMEARKALVDCLLADLDPDILEAAVSALDDPLGSARPDSNDAARAQVSIDALDAFATKLLDSLDLAGLTIERGETYAERLAIAGVTVSVSPDFVVRSSKGVGALVLYFNKTNPLDENSGAYVASLLHQFVEERLGHVGVPDPGACRVIDVLNGKVYTAPKSYKRRRQDIEAACQEIAAVWAGL